MRPLNTGGIGTAAIFYASISVSLAHTAIRIFYLFLSPPIRALNTIRVSLTGSRALGTVTYNRCDDRSVSCV